MEAALNHIQTYFIGPMLGHLVKSTIGLHPHQGFEICSFVLKGKINHFDTKQNKWIPLSEGDVQIIRSEMVFHARD